VFSTATVQRENALIDRKISGKFDERLSIRLDKLDLTRETLLTCDLAPYPSCLPFSPRWEGEGFKNGIGGIEVGDRSVEITVDLRRSDLQRTSCVDLALWLVMNRRTPFVTERRSPVMLQLRLQD
jgi:hypothetical protein